MTSGTRDRSPRRCCIPALVAWGAVALAGAACHAQTAEPTAKKLIEFGWDEPDTSFLRQHIAEMERAPFDGCVFHVMTVGPGGNRENFTWLGWGKRAFTEEEFRPALDDLKATPFHHFTHNFLRFNTAPADVDWFDDFAPIVKNARLVARVAREGKCAGILLDTEEYEGKLFTYSRQRDAKTKPWDAYASQARRRGREVMEAIQEGFPDVTLFLTFGHSMSWTMAKNGTEPPSESNYGLLAPFVDGLVEAAKGKTRVVDGYELSYGFTKKTQFADAYRQMREEVLLITEQPDRYRRVVSAGFGIWMDYDWREKGWDVEDPSKNYFTPKLFEASVRRALIRSDEFVWIYTETPRWWSPEGGRVKLPGVYDRAIRWARNPLVTE